MCPGPAESVDVFLYPTLTSDNFAALLQNQYLELHLKDPTHACLEPEAQGH